MVKRLKKSMALLLAVSITMLASFPNIITGNSEVGLTASAATVEKTAPQGDGSVKNPYKISTAGELYWFADKITNDNENYDTKNAVLTADITVNENVLNDDGTLNTDNTDLKMWTPIGFGTLPTNLQGDIDSEVGDGYNGTFDGQGHTISGLYYNDATTTKPLGLFGVVEEKGVVKNVCVVDSYLKGNTGVGGICAGNDGLITNCYYRGVVEGGLGVGGIVGGMYTNGKVTNCYADSSVAGEDYQLSYGGFNMSMPTYGGVCGVVYAGTVSNCYYNNEKFDDNKPVGYSLNSNSVGKDVLGKSAEEFTSGEVAYLLQSKQTTDEKLGVIPKVWSQTLPAADFPVFGDDVVYYDEELSYHNHGNFCEKCDVPKNENGVYQISDSGELYWFANYVNNTDSTANAVLTLNILINDDIFNENGEFNSESSTDFAVWDVIGSDTAKYTGTFNGQGHKIIGIYFNDSSVNNVGLFGSVGKDGAVLNVGVENSYIAGGENIGGLCGSNEDGELTNCYYTGSVGGTSSVGGLAGANSGTVSNGYYFGTVTADSKKGALLGTNSGTVENCCYNSTLCQLDFAGENTNDSIINISGYTTEQFAAGEVAYVLDQNDGIELSGAKIWGQELRADNKAVSPTLIQSISDDTERVKLVVRKVRFITNKEEDTDCKMLYLNHWDYITEFPEDPEVPDGYKFLYWTDDATTKKEFTLKDYINSDTKLYAVVEVEYGVSDGEKTVTTAYGTEKTQSLAEYTVFDGKIETTGKFTYTIESGNDTLGAAIDGDMLKISDTAPAGSYTLKIKAAEIETELALMGDEVGAEPIEFNVSVVVEPIKETVPNISINFKDETLEGFATGSYTIDGTAVTPADGKVSAADYIGKTVSIVMKASDTNHADSDAQTLAVPARPAAPSKDDFDVAQPSEISGTGEIDGVTADMEFKTDTVDGWVPMEDAVPITGIPGGVIFYIRIKATDTAFKSDSCEIAINTFGAEPETTPNIGIDIANEMLTGFENAKYAIDGKAVTPTDGKVSAADYMGKTVSIVKKGNAVTTTDSAEQTLEVPARPAAPTQTQIAVTQPNTIGGTGSISGITADMEYSADNGVTWTSGDGNAVTGVLGGTKYLVRYKTTATAFRSENYEVLINAFVAAPETTPDIKIDFVNEMLTDFATGSYTIDGAAVTPVDGKVSATDYMGKTVSIVKKGDAATTADSVAQMLKVPARPTAPAENKIKVTQPDIVGGTGSVSGITAAMEYSTDGGNTWTTGNGTAVSGIVGGTNVVIRTKAVENVSFSGESYTVKINVYEKVPAATPNITINYKAETLTGFENGEYTINGTPVVLTDGEVSATAYIGTTISVVRKGTENKTSDSNAQTLAVPARPAAPAKELFTLTQPDTVGGTGTIAGMTTKMEYIKDGYDWTSGTGFAVSNIPGGTTYTVRYKATDESFRSESCELLIVEFKNAPTPSPSPSPSPSAGITPIGKYTGKVEINKEIQTVEMTNKAVFTITSLTDDLSLTATLYIAEYDSEGRLIGIQLDRKNIGADGKLTLGVDVPKTSNYKFMIWDDLCSPIIAPITNLD